MKNLMYACVSGAALAAILHFVAASAQAQAPSAPVRAASAGRWTIVNGTPELARNIMLLDTATGDTWVECTIEDGSNVWCVVPKTSGTSGSTSTGK